VVDGYGNGLFGPEDDITREQLAVMLWCYAGTPAATDKELHFTDADEVSGWALEAMRWAVENGIITGKASGILDPASRANRTESRRYSCGTWKNNNFAGSGGLYDRPQTVDKVHCKIG